MKDEDLKDLDLEKGDEKSVEDIDTPVKETSHETSEFRANQRPDGEKDHSASDEEIGSKPAMLPISTKRPKSHLAFAVIVGLLIILGVVFFIWKDQILSYLVKQPVNDMQKTATNSVPSALEQQKINDPELKNFITPTTGEKWQGTPKDMAAQGWLKVELASSYKDVGVGTSYYKSAKQQLTEATPTYKEVGSRAGNTIVLVNSPSEGMNGLWYLFEKYPDGKVAAIIRPQAASPGAPETLSETKDAVTSKVTVFDETTHYDSLNIPTKIALENGEYTLRPERLWIFDGWISTNGSGVTTTQIAKLGASSLYRMETKYADTGLTNIGYYMQLPLGTKVGLRYQPNQASLEGYSFDNGATLQVAGVNGKTTYDELVAIARGCGGSAASVTRTDVLKEADLVQVGKNEAGAPVYEVKDKTAALYKKAYDEYKDTNGAGAVSMDVYIKNHGMVVMKDAKGELLVYVRATYAPSMGCAKPVVYLYPIGITSVDVKVGANVTVSDPYYPAGGWKNVLANPNGQLTYLGKNYDSLFWEGTGVGNYPGITSGTVVKRDQAASTIRKQLAEQGLNAKETNDFMAFWESKIPNKPYIRLTWLGTADMNALAPLHVSPKPDTVIRVFLDMDGFDTPINLPVQKFSAPERKGFTVVEWGGLTSEIHH